MSNVFVQIPESAFSEEDCLSSSDEEPPELVDSSLDLEDPPKFELGAVEEALKREDVNLEPSEPDLQEVKIQVPVKRGNVEICENADGREAGVNIEDMKKEFQTYLLWNQNVWDKSFKGVFTDFQRIKSLNLERFKKPLRDLAIEVGVKYMREKIIKEFEAMEYDYEQPKRRYSFMQSSSEDEDIGLSEGIEPLPEEVELPKESPKLELQPHVNNSGNDVLSTVEIPEVSAPVLDWTKMSQEISPHKEENTVDARDSQRLSTYMLGPEALAMRRQQSNLQNRTSPTIIASRENVGRFSPY